MICAKINQASVVEQVVVAESCEWCKEQLGGEWVETKKDGSVRGCYAGLGYFYDSTADIFVPPQDDTDQ